MLSIEFGNYAFRTEKRGNKTLIFDIVRRKAVALTPEEFLRQNWLHYLIFEKGFPKSLLSVEKGIRVHQMTKRYDITACDRQGKPVLLVELKAPGVAITENTLLQATNYNLTIGAPLLLLSNGTQHFCFLMEKEIPAVKELSSLPGFEDLKNRFDLGENS